MTIRNIKPTTIEGVKRLAKTYKKTHDVPHHSALDLASIDAGFNNYRQAFSALNSSGSRELFTVFVSGWWVGTSRGEEMKMVNVHLKKPLHNYCLSNGVFELENCESFRVAGDGDILEMTETVSSEAELEKWVFKAARALQFMDSSGLIPYRFDDFDFTSPKYWNDISDHDSLWIEPTTETIVILTEPYQFDPNIMRRFMQNTEWTLRCSWWSGIHNPGYTQTLLVTRKDDASVLDLIMRRLDKDAFDQTGLKFLYVKDSKNYQEILDNLDYHLVYENDTHPRFHPIEKYISPDWNVVAAVLLKAATRDYKTRDRRLSVRTKSHHLDMAREYAEEAIQIDPLVAPAYLIKAETMDRDGFIETLEAGDKIVCQKIGAWPPHPKQKLHPSYLSQILLNKAELGDQLILRDNGEDFEKGMEYLWDVAILNEEGFHCHLSYFNAALAKRRFDLIVKILSSVGERFSPNYMYEAAEIAFRENSEKASELVMLALQFEEEFGRVLANGGIEDFDDETVLTIETKLELPEIEDASSFVDRNSEFPRFVGKMISPDQGILQ